MDKFLTIKQVCDLLGLGRSTVYRANQAGQLPFVKIGRATRITQTALQAYIDTLPVEGDCPQPSQ